MLPPRINDYALASHYPISETVITYHADIVWAVSASLAATKEIDFSFCSYRY